MTMGFLARIVGLLCAAGALAGCIAAPDGKQEARKPLPMRAVLQDVPYYPPSDGDTTSAAAAMLLGWTGLAVTPPDLTAALGAGDSHKAVVKVARRHGRLVYPLGDWSEVLGELAAGHPVLLDMERPGEARCMVALGYDLAEQTLLVHSPMRPHDRRPLAEASEAWLQAGAWAVVVLPPGELPATVEKDEYIDAAAGLERDGPAWEAVLALDSALALWHDSVEALMGLGKSLFALGDRKGAEEAFATASTLSDDPSVDGWRWAILQAGFGNPAEGGAGPPVN